MDELVKVWIVQLNGEGEYTVANIEDILPELLEMDPDDEDFYTIHCKYMTQTEIENLPEFDGF